MARKYISQAVHQRGLRQRAWAPAHAPTSTTRAPSVATVAQPVALQTAAATHEEGGGKKAAGIHLGVVAQIDAGPK